MHFQRMMWGCCSHNLFPVRLKAARSGYPASRQRRITGARKDSARASHRTRGIADDAMSARTNDSGTKGIMGMKEKM